MNEFQSSSVSSRVDDIHDAFRDKNVRMIITCIGGFNVNQTFKYLDYDLIGANPNIPIIFGIDFGHVFPIITYPIGGKVQIKAKIDKIDIQIIEH